MKTVIGNFLLVVVSTIVGLLALEVATRFLSDKPILSSYDWRNHNAHGPTGQYDPYLGWVLRANNRTNAKDGVNTIDHGIRKNKLNEPESIQEGAILAVGDSFTAGSEVSDNETWPAFLERALGQRVLNAGVGAYGVDQSILRAEALLPVLKPKTVLVGVLAPDDIQRVRYKNYGNAKPYFERDGETFRLMNNPVPKPGLTPSREPLGNAIKNILVRIYFVHKVMSRLVPQWWFSGAADHGDSKSPSEQVFEKAPNNPIDVSCFLLERLAGELAEAQARGVLVIQYGGWTYSRSDPRNYEAEELEKCATAYGFDVVDEFETLAAIARGSIDGLQSHYVMSENDTVYGHMSAEGNALVAGLVAEALKQPAEAPMKSKTVELEVGDGLNRLEAGHFKSLAGLTKRNLPENSIAPGAIIQKLNSSEQEGEHYTSINWVSEEPGIFIFSVYVRPVSNSGVRLQIYDSEYNGALVDFQPKGGLYNVTRLGNGERINFMAENRTNGWQRLSLSVRTKKPNGSVLLQVIKDLGASSFGGPAVVLDVQAPMVERGETASPWCEPEVCKHLPVGSRRIASRPKPGDGINRLTEEIITSLSLLHVQSLDAADGGKENSARKRLAASKDEGEHYAVLAWTGEEAGRYTSSVFVRFEPQTAVRMQLIDAGGNGAVVDYRPAAKDFQMTYVGSGRRARFVVDRQSGEWSRLTLSVDLQAAHGNMIIQVSKEDGTTFYAGDGEALFARAPMVEFGGTASDWCRPIVCVSLQFRSEVNRLGDGVNRLESAMIDVLAQATAPTVPDGGVVPEAPVQRLSSSLDAGEHYGLLKWSAKSAGIYSLSIYIREMSNSGVRLQFLDARNNGAILDYHPSSGLEKLTRTGKAQGISYSIEAVDQGWKRLSLRAGMQLPKGAIIVQLMNSAAAKAFEAERIVLDVQAPMVERGGKPTTWCRPDACN